VGNLKWFLLGLGWDIAFVGEHYVVQFGGRDFRLDLLFFIVSCSVSSPSPVSLNRFLKCGPASNAVLKTKRISRRAGIARVPPRPAKSLPGSSFRQNPAGYQWPSASPRLSSMSYL